MTSYVYTDPPSPIYQRGELVNVNSLASWCIDSGLEPCWSSTTNHKVNVVLERVREAEPSNLSDGIIEEDTESLSGPRTPDSEHWSIFGKSKS
ncbi:hypothetical protein AB4304_14000 [Vibrio breoganii]